MCVNSVSLAGCEKGEEQKARIIGKRSSGMLIPYHLTHHLAPSKVEFRFNAENCYVTYM